MASSPSSELSDEDLLARHLAGDQEAFGQLVVRYGPVVQGLMRRGMARPQDADELVQDTFVLLHRSAASFDPSRRLRPWLLTIAHNVKREYFRRKGRRPEEELVLDGRRDPSVKAHDLDRRDAQKELDRALAQLPDAQRQVVELHWLAGLSMPEVADTVGISLSAAKVRAHRAYKRMKAYLMTEGA
jgi:RNA polymerase sigma factor (sigma-70 family)